MAAVFGFAAAALNRAPASDSGEGSPQVVAARPLIISEFRLNGTGGANDEFIEIYNASNSDHTVASSDGSSGYALAASDGAVRFTIPQNTVIPARGHYLGCNSAGFSLASYPAGNGTTATCDATYTMNIPNGEGSNPVLPRRGIALFSTSNSANFNFSTRLDAVGPTAESNTLYKEGSGVRNLSPFNVAYSYVRRLPDGCIGTDAGTIDANCINVAGARDTFEPTSVHPQDTDNNLADFIYLDTNGTPQSLEGRQQRLGAPGPENSTSPIVRQGSFKVDLVFPSVCPECPPNQVRDITPDSDNNSSFGTLEIRRKITNQTGGNVTRLRFRVVDITTFPAGQFVVPAGTNCGDAGTECAADLRPRSSTQITLANPPADGGGTVTIQGTTVEEAGAPEHQPNGGGFNTSLSAGSITLATPLANGASMNVRFLLGVQQKGTFRFAFTIEALP